VARFELFGAASCPYTRELREWLEWKRCDFEEHDVEANSAARQRLLSLAGGQCTVPVLVEEGKIVQIGWQGRSCVIS